VSELADLVDPLKRTVAVPGTFAETFPATGDDDLEATLLDAFAEAQLDGFFAEAFSDDDGLVSPDLARGEGALVVIYAAARIITAELRNRKTHVRYEASGAVFEQDTTASLLVALLKDLSARKLDLLTQARQRGHASAFLMADAYFIRATSVYPIGGMGEDRAYDYLALGG
jgi:hypothetical protein